jgi:hypothetical protein
MRFLSLQVMAFFAVFYCDYPGSASKKRGNMLCVDKNIRQSNIAGDH